LPAAKPAGVALAATDDVVRPGKPVRLTLAATHPGMLKVTLSKNDVEVAQSHVRFVGDGPQASSGPPTVPVNRPAEIVLEPKPEIDGVLIATVWDDKGTPLAERLIFRKPARQIKIDVKA